MLEGFDHDALSKALLDVALGENVGSGANRDVYEFYSADTGFVIKLSKEHGHSSNVLEHNIWHEFSNTKHAKWLAQAYYISKCGTILIQKRLTPLGGINDPRIPKRIPRWLEDLKIENWGIDPADGLVKCCDYGLCKLLTNNPWQLKNAKWWSITGT